ncbi:MAG: hypothetical protein MRJ67_15530 [Nitrospirales bacterium]|nr:hypothetical protein [Nitrospirales bacterium]
MTAITDLSKEQIRQAGQRYTPGIDPRAPNLRIASLFTTIENLACGAGALARFQAVLEELSEAWDRAKHGSQHTDAVQACMEEARASLVPMMPRLRGRDAQAGEGWVEYLTRLETVLSADMAHWRAEEEKLPPLQGERTYSRERDTVQGNINAILRCLSVVREEKEYTTTSAFKVLYDPHLLVSGEWGTGKTHLLCDVTQERINRGQATVLVLAKNFEGHVVSEICGRIEPTRMAEEVFDRLQEVACRLGERAVVIVDGVNEGRRREWRQAVTALRALVASRPEIGLIISCRSPFEAVAIAQEDLNYLHEVLHQGFDDQEFDAQAAFFQYYRLPLPEVPLLDREFSRPLTLKLICQSLQNLTGQKLAKGFAGIASGQKGMTYVLESFVKQIGKPIEDEFRLVPKGCWLLLKGNDQIGDRRRAGFVPCVASTGRGYVRLSEADRIIAANYPDLSAAQRRKLLEALRTNGLIEEDAIWYTSRTGIKWRIVFRLPYQRFSDHLVARYLLKTHLNVSSVSAIKRSFSSTSPLGRIFKLANRYTREYAQPGLAQALITEFPERVGTRLPRKDRELFFALPRRAQSLSAYFEPFIEGLFWRDPAAFTEGTHRLINSYLNADGQMWERVIDALAAVSTKPKHPYHARRLYDFLAQFMMPDRDLKWSEYLRRKYASPTIHRLLTWAGKLNVASMTEESAKELIVLLSLVLTTVVRNDRDLATKALVQIGEKFPKILFEHVASSFGFNDPYVSERLLAAAYGVTLSLVDSEGASTFRPLLGAFAKTLYKKMFEPSATYVTHHTLKRDYALGIIEVAQRVRCVSLPKRASRDLTPPYPQTRSTFASDGTPDATVTEALGRAIKMDFGNYTIGCLIPDRRNYDDKHPEYVRVRAQIERRIFDLGYRQDQFDALDREISNTSFRTRDEYKVDRYGKKYSWIAYFEMWGEREATKVLPDWRLGERTPDCGVDPSFPKPPPDWTPPIPDLFGDLRINTEAWVKGGFTPRWKPLLVVPEINGHQGEWVLVEGYVCSENEEHDRELFVFLRGAFVARRDLSKLKAKFLGVDYPGNGRIPTGAKEFYLFAGEAGRRNNYAPHLLQRNGRYRRQVQDAFDGWSQRGRHNSGIRLELPSICFAWESYHSACNAFSGFDLPAPSLIQHLALASRNRGVDFYDATGSPGTLYREAGDELKGNRHRLLYVRADLLRRYLTETRQVLVWCNWGERDWLKKMEGHVMLQNPTRQRIYQEYRHIHRSFSHWRG